ncbi:MAG: hypothetical protein VST72_02620, partial [Nitrospirota bacterium]|nr:hypothetical protein [Nitrospirota bacterium]
FYLLVMLLALSLTVYGCGGSGDGGGTAAGIYTINTTGADGGPNGGSGGSGGDIEVYSYDGSSGPIEILKTGVANASWTPTTAVVNLGSNPLSITSATTIAVVTVEPASGIPYLVADDYALYISDGDSSIQDETPVTGISVASGITLTLGLNYNIATGTRIDLSNDIDNHGTITTVDYSATQRGDLRLYMASYHGNSAIDTSGTQDGQSGGDVYLYPNYSFFNNGTINSSGYGSITGAAGNGGHVGIYSDYRIENTGDITSDGGTASGGGTTGGNAGYIDLEAYYGDLFNSGDLSSRGGDGVTAGGNGEWQELYIDYVGELLNSGNMDASGGDATAGNGGYGDWIYLTVYGGGIINSGDLTTTGGATTDAASNGGNGGGISIYVDYGYIYESTPAGDILFSGDINTSGGLAVTGTGATGSGGSGGDVYIEGDFDYYPLGQRIALLGYTGIDSSGGDGNYGGYGGDVEFYHYYGWSDAYYYVPSGDVTNEVDVNATGGDVVAGATTIPADGGDGGDFDMETDYYYGMFNPDIDKVVNKGDINTSGGNSLESTTNWSGDAGWVWIWGYNGVTNSGNITAVGGDDLGTDGGVTGYGNAGNDIDLYAELGPVKNTGDLDSSGGDGEYDGGRADNIGLFGPEVTNSGDLTANGGDANVSLAGSTGGDADYVELYAPGGRDDITQSGTVTNNGGAGATAGTDGDYILGGELM